MTTIEALYQNGVLKPSRPLEIVEGQSVEITVEERIPPATIEEWRQRMSKSGSYGELKFLMRHCPEPDRQDGYDLIAELDKTRRAVGARLLNPEAST